MSRISAWAAVANIAATATVINKRFIFTSPCYAPLGLVYRLLGVLSGSLTALRTGGLAGPVGVVPIGVVGFAALPIGEVPVAISPMHVLMALATSRLPDMLTTHCGSSPSGNSMVSCAASPIIDSNSLVSSPLMLISIKLLDVLSVFGFAMPFHSSRFLSNVNTTLTSVLSVNFQS